MADVRLLFPADYLTAAWLKGRDVPLTIAKVHVDDLKTDRGSEKKPVIVFRELEAKRAKGETGVPFKFVLNRTCAKVIAALYGHETNDWVGKRVTLFPTTCQAFGQTVDCIRVRDKAPQGAPKRPAPEPEPMDDADSEAAFDEVR